MEPETESAERVERGAYDTRDDPGGSADREARGRDRDHIEEQSPDDFDEVDDEEVSHG